MKEFSINDLPIGSSNFEDIIEIGAYFVDKSLFIKDVLDNAVGAILITRPRRFGKTLNMRMLKCYLEGKLNLFEGLKIEGWDKFDSYYKKYNVISLSFKDLKFNNYEDFIFKFRKYMQGIASDFDLDEDKNILKSIEESLSESLRDLTKVLYKKTKKKSIVLIDEYDVPINSGYECGYYEEIIQFMRSFLGNALKDNEYVRKSILTGVLRVSKEGIFSGFNNLMVFTMEDDRYGEYFGFTREEIEKLIYDTKTEIMLEDLSKMYNGYNVNGVSIFNPWSILSCLFKKKLDYYWVNTGNPKMIVDLMRNFKENKLNELLEEKQVECNLKSDISYKDFDGEIDFDILGSILFQTGYLTLGNKKNTVKIPNLEVKYCIAEILKKHLIADLNSSLIITIMHNLIECKFELFKENLQKIFLQSTSYYDFKDESNYHIALLIMVQYLGLDYVILSNREAGHGRYDISLVERKGEKAFILELKVAEKEEDLLKMCGEALKQIDKQKYAEGLCYQYSNVKMVYKLGIAFCKKKVEVLWRLIE